METDPGRTIADAREEVAALRSGSRIPRHSMEVVGERQTEETPRNFRIQKHRQRNGEGRSNRLGDTREEAGLGRRHNFRALRYRRVGEDRKSTDFRTKVAEHRCYSLLVDVRVPGIGDGHQAPWEEEGRRTWRVVEWKLLQLLLVDSQRSLSGL